METKPVATVLLCTVALLQSCVSIYVPSVQNVPIFKEKGETKLSATTNDYQAAYAVTNHFAVIANAKYSNKHEYEFMRTTNWMEMNRMIEIGAGYFQQTKKAWTQEIYAGAGIFKSTLSTDNERNTVHSNVPAVDELGKVIYTKEIIKRHISATGNRFFIQPSVGFASKVIDVSFSTRLVGLKFNSIVELKNDQPAMGDARLQGVKFGLFVEPAVTTQLGYKWVKIRIQTGLSLRTSARFEGNQYVFGSIGIIGDIGKWYK